MRHKKSAPESDIAVLDDSSTDSSSSLTYSRAIHQAGSGVAALAKGTGGLGFLLGKAGYTLAKTGVARARVARSELAARSEAARAAATDVAAVGSGSSTRTRLAIGAGVFAVVAAGAAFFSASRRRKTAPPVADAPPTLGPSANGSAPAVVVDEEARATP